MFKSMLTLSGTQIYHAQEQVGMVAIVLDMLMPESGMRYLILLEIATSFNDFSEIISAWNGFKCLCAMCR